MIKDIKCYSLNMHLKIEWDKISRMWTINLRKRNTKKSKAIWEVFNSICKSACSLLSICSTIFFCKKIRTNKYRLLPCHKPHIVLVPVHLVISPDMSPLAPMAQRNTGKYCHTQLHLGFSAGLKIQVPTCKMEPQRGCIMQKTPSTHPTA